MIERVVICLDNILGYLRCITTVVARDWNQCGDKNVCAVTRSTAHHYMFMLCPWAMRRCYQCMEHSLFCNVKSRSSYIIIFVSSDWNQCGYQNVWAVT